MRKPLDVVDVSARGRRLVADGRPAVRERWLEPSRRDIHLTGAKS